MIPKIIKPCPVFGGWLYAEEAAYHVKQKDGWYVADVLNRQIERPAEITDLALLKGQFKAFNLQGEMIPASFDRTRRLFGRAKLPEWSFKAEAQEFDDCFFVLIRKKLFFVRAEAGSPSLTYLAQAIRGGEKLEFLKGITPEETYAISCFNVLWQEEQRKVVAETLEGKIKHALDFAGAKLIEFKKSANQLVDVIWEVTARNITRRFSSLVREDSLKVYHAGFCLSGADDKHTLATLPAMAERGIQQNAIVITGHHEDEDDF